MTSLRVLAAHKLYEEYAPSGSTVVFRGALAVTMLGQDLNISYGKSNGCYNERRNWSRF